MPSQWKSLTSLSFAWLLSLSSQVSADDATPKVAKPGPIVRALTPEAADETAEVAEESQEVFVDDQDQQHSGETVDTEAIRERFPNGAVKIERHIAEDSAGNLVNHGRWTQWDQAGSVVGTGDFEMGKQHGRWVRYLGPGEGKMFTAQPYKQFERPFVSEITFDHGRMHGTWYVVDARKRRVMQCEFADDRPHGPATWWYASGQKMREVTYREGKLDGEFVEWNQNSQIVTADNYKDGRKHTVKIEWYSPGKKKSEGPYLMARQITEETYDWWTASVTSKNIGKEGTDERHGHWVWWYPNGMKKMEGTYEEGQPNGKFAWWYPNSQKYIEGSYVKGKQDNNWTWWHPNGLTQFKGEYIAGLQHGRWTGYSEDGKLIEVQEFTAGHSSEHATVTAEQATPPELIDLGTDSPSVTKPRLQAILPNAADKSSRRGKMR